jgi:transcriptional regulator with XRE-family HTH domain
MTLSFAERLNHLFATVQPAGRGPYTNAEVAGSTGLAESLIGYLRSGKRANPTLHTLSALGRHFGVSAAYFVDDQVAAQVTALLTQLRLLELVGGALQRDEVRELVARLAGLSAESIAAMSVVVDQLSRLEQPALVSARTRS